MVLDKLIAESYNNELAKISAKKATLANRVNFYTRVLKTENDLSNHNLDDFYVHSFAKKTKKGLVSYTQIRMNFFNIENKQITFTCLGGRTENFNIKNPSDKIMNKLQIRWVAFKDKYDIDTIVIKNKISLCETLLTDVIKQII
jgi:hypothetical protein